jgi:hypothetical protein
MVYYEIQINLDTLTYSATLSDIDILFHLSKLGYMVIWHGILQNCRNIQGLTRVYERCVQSVHWSGSRRA